MAAAAASYSAETGVMAISTENGVKENRNGVIKLNENYHEIMAIMADTMKRK
jgi:hypothetical protein